MSLAFNVRPGVFLRGESLMLKRREREEVVLFIANLPCKMATVINTKGLVEAVYIFELMRVDDSHTET